MTTMYSHPYPVHGSDQTVDYTRIQQNPHIPFTNQLAYQSTFTPEGFNFESPFIFSSSSSAPVSAGYHPSPQHLQDPSHLQTNTHELNPYNAPGQLINYGLGGEGAWNGEEKKAQTPLVRPGINLATGDRFSQLLEQKLGLDHPPTHQSPTFQQHHFSSLAPPATPGIPSHINSFIQNGLIPKTNHSMGAFNQELAIETALHDFSQVTIPPDFVAPLPPQFLSSWGMGQQPMSTTGPSESHTSPDLISSFSTTPSYGHRDSRGERYDNVPTLAQSSPVMPFERVPMFPTQSPNSHLMIPPQPSAFPTLPMMPSPATLTPSSGNSPVMQYLASTQSHYANQPPASRSRQSPVEENLPPLLKIRVHTPDQSQLQNNKEVRQATQAGQYRPGAVKQKPQPARTSKVELGARSRLSALSASTRIAAMEPSSAPLTSPTSDPMQSTNIGSWALEMLGSNASQSDQAWVGQPAISSVYSSLSNSDSFLQAQQAGPSNYVSSKAPTTLSSPLKAAPQPVSKSTSPASSVQRNESKGKGKTREDLSPKEKITVPGGKAEALKKDQASVSVKDTSADGAANGEDKKIIIACHMCRARKLKCDGNKPKCHHCSRRNEDSCVYDAILKRRGPGRNNKKKRSRRGDGDVDGRKRRRRTVTGESTERGGEGDEDGDDSESGEEDDVGVDQLGIGPGRGLGGGTSTTGSASLAAPTMVGLNSGMTTTMSMDDTWSGSILDQKSSPERPPQLASAPYPSVGSQFIASGLSLGMGPGPVVPRAGNTNSRFEMSQARD